jgi:hypothetical protein
MVEYEINMLNGRSQIKISFIENYNMHANHLIVTGKSSIVDWERRRLMGRGCQENGSLAR